MKSYQNQTQNTRRRSILLEIESNKNCEIIGTSNYCKIVKATCLCDFSIALNFVYCIIVISIGFCTLSVIIRQQKELIGKYHIHLVSKTGRIESTKRVSSFKIISFKKKRKVVKGRKRRENDAMKLEVNSAADFMMNLLRVRQQVNSLSETQLHSFRGSLIIVLLEKYNNHWYETNPRKGTLTSLHSLVHIKPPNMT